MKALPPLLAGVALASIGCSWFSQSTRTQFGPAAPYDAIRPIAPEFAPDSGTVPGDGAPFIPDPNAFVPPTIELGTPTFDPPAVASRTRERALSDSSVESTAVAADEPQWQNAFESTQRRPIQTLRFGEGPFSVLVTGNLAGNDPHSVETMDRLASLLASDSSLSEGLTVILVRNPNPDALAEHLSVNTRGVDINRNFPSARFTAAPTQRTGPHPASEAETRVMLRLLGDEKPQRVIHIRAANRKRSLVTATGATIEQLATLEDGANCDFNTFQGVYKSGSLEEFSATRLKADVIVIDIPAARGSIAEKNRLLMASLHGSANRPGNGSPPPEGVPDAKTNPPIAAQDRIGPATFTGDVESVDPDGSRGFVQLLPPPPDAPGDGTDDPRYYELSPAP